MNEDELEPIGEEPPVEEIQEEAQPTGGASSALSPELVATMREIMREELRAANARPVEEPDPASAYSGTTTLTRFEVVDLIMDDVLEANSGELEDMPKDVRKAIRDELRGVCAREDVDPMQVRASGYGMKVALQHIVEAQRKKSYTPAAWKLSVDEPTRTAAPVAQSRPKASQKQREEAADLAAVFGQDHAGRLLGRVIGA